MNKTKLIKQLTWDYFWQGKKKEVCEHFEGGWLLYLFFMCLFGVFFQVGWINNIDTGQPYCKPLAIIGLFFIGIWVFIGLVALIVVIWEWIESNWEKARLKAIQDVKKMKKGGKK